jgi:hypothetical protein
MKITFQGKDIRITGKYLSKLKVFLNAQHMTSELNAETRTLNTTFINFML